jgi:hypothetical protein
MSYVGQILCQREFGPFSEKISRTQLSCLPMAIKQAVDVALLSMVWRSWQEGDIASCWSERETTSDRHPA